MPETFDANVPLIAELRISAPDGPQVIALRGIAVAFGWKLTIRAADQQPENIFFDETHQRLLDTKLTDVAEGITDYKVTNALYAASRQDIDIVRDAIAIGKKGLIEARGIAADSADRIIAALDNHVPDIPVPEKADPAYIARFCSTLKQVTWLCLGRTYFNFSDEFERPSVHDFLTVPPERLFRGELFPHELREHRDFRNRAEKFAAMFSPAQDLAT